jgi:hypothetical protein
LLQASVSKTSRGHAKVDLISFGSQSKQDHVDVGGLELKSRRLEVQHLDRLLGIRAEQNPADVVAPEHLIERRHLKVGVVPVLQRPQGCAFAELLPFEMRVDHVLDALGEIGFFRAFFDALGGGPLVHALAGAGLVGPQTAHK